MYTYACNHATLWDPQSARYDGAHGHGASNILAWKQQQQFGILFFLHFDRKFVWRENERKTVALKVFCALCHSILQVLFLCLKTSEAPGKEWTKWWLCGKLLTRNAVIKWLFIPVVSRCLSWYFQVTVKVLFDASFYHRDLWSFATHGCPED